MATRQRRLEIVIAWMQEHPGVVKNVQSQLRSLAGSYGYLKTQTDKLNLTSEEQAVFQDALKQTYDEMRVRTGETAQTVKMLGSAMKTTTRIMKEQDESTGGLTTSSGRLGFRLGWLGFRMASMGRMILKSAVDPLKKMMGTLTDWEKGLESVAVALGLQEAGLGDTGKSAEELRAIMAEMPRTGMEFETAMGGMQATMWELAQNTAPALIDILAAVQDIVETVGTAFFVSMAEGLANALEAGAEFLKVFKPFMPLLGKLFAGLVILSPILIAVGSAMFLMTPFMIAGSMGLGAMAISAGGLTIALGPLVLGIVAVGAAVTLLIVFWDDLEKIFESFIPTIKGVSEVLEIVVTIIGAMGTVMSLLSPILVAGAMSMGIMSLSVGGLTIALSPLLLAIVAIGAAITLVILFWDDLMKAFNSAGNILGGLLSAGTIALTGRQTGPQFGGNQDIVIYSDVNIESLSADVDYERVRDSVNTGIGDALRSRSYPGGLVG